MATEITAITGVSVSDDGETITVVDEYAYGSGGNPARAGVGVHLAAYKVDEDLVETALTVTAFDPNDVDTFTVTYDSDGRNKFVLVFAPDWSIGTTYDQYDVVWSTAEEAFYQYINDASTAGNAVTDTDYWEAVDNPASLVENVGETEEPGLLYYQVYEAILDFNTAKCYADVVILACKEGCTDDCDCKSKIGRAKSKIRTLLSVMRVSHVRGRYIAGEKAAREAERYCDDCGCLDR